MRTPDRRTTLRLLVQFHTTLSASSTLEETGLMRNLSSSGCCIDTPLTVEPGTLLALRIYAPNLESPLVIESAHVKWIRDQTFGLAFIRITEAEQRRLGQLVHDLMEE